MTLIKVSGVVKEELEQLKKEGEFKSLDAVIRHYIDSSVVVTGGIFLGSLEEERNWDTFFINTRNTRHTLIVNNFTYSFISPPTTIKLYKCLKCQTITTQNEGEPIIVPNCAGCGKGMTPITIQIGLKEAGG